MIIKKYNLYKESSSNPTLEKFVIDLYSVCAKFGSQISLYGNELAKTNRDPNSDLNLFKQRMLAKGWDKSTVVQLFESEEDVTRYVDIDEEFEEDLHPISQMNGLVDLYLMYCESLTGQKKYKFEFGGGGGHNPDDLVAEATMRYAYGYHKTKYGKLANSVVFPSVEEYKKLVFQGIDDMFYWKHIPMLEDLDDDAISQLSQFVQKDEATLQFKIDLKGVFHELQHENIFEGEVEYEDFVQECITYFGEIFEEYEYVKTDLILNI
jgi:hypothetical protein